MNQCFACNLFYKDSAKNEPVKVKGSEDICKDKEIQEFRQIRIGILKALMITKSTAKQYSTVLKIFFT